MSLDACCCGYYEFFANDGAVYDITHEGVSIMSYFPTHRQPDAQWSEYLDQWCTWLKVKGCTPRTIEHWWHIVTHFARVTQTEPLALCADDNITLITRGVKSAAMRSDYNALNSFFTFLHDRGYRADNPMLKVPSTKRSKDKQKPAPEEAVQEGLNFPDPQIALVVVLMSDFGLRRSEVAQLHRKDLIQDKNGECYLIVHGKGDKDRILPLNRRLLKRIADFNPSGWFFSSS